MTVLYVPCWLGSGNQNHKNHCRANMAHIEQLRPDSGLGFLVKVLNIFNVFPLRLDDRPLAARRALHWGAYRPLPLWVEDANCGSGMQTVGRGRKPWVGGANSGSGTQTAGRGRNPPPRPRYSHLLRPEPTACLPCTDPTRTLHPEPSTLNPTPSTLNLQPSTLNSQLPCSVSASVCLPLFFIDFGR